MRKELDDKLCAKYPKLFRDRHAPMTVTCMCWGFDCGDGWYNIIDALCGNIQSYVDNKREQRARVLRYNRLLKRALDGDPSGLEKYYALGGEVTDWTRKMVAQDIENGRFRTVPDKVYQVIVSQVKEKYGSLRFYVDYGDDTVYGMISMAESMSYRTCEVCGNPGEANTEGWISVRCETHR